MAGSAGFEPAWACTLTVFKTFRLNGLGWILVENGSLFWKAKSGWNAFIFQEKFASTPCAAKKIELTATRAKKRFNQEKKERFRREKARFWEIGEKKERNLALDFSPKMSPLTRESMIHFLLLLAKKAEVYHMKTNHYYSDLLRQYPAYMTKEQMYQVCHISKKTCLFLLQSGLVPCLDSGKKTRRFKIETANVIRYLADRELHPDRYKPPEGFYKRKRVKGKSRRKKRRKQGTDTPSPSVTGVDPCIMREYYRAELELYPDDVLTTKQISEFTGYSHSSVVRWCNKEYLQNFYIRHRFYVPKEYLLDFFTSRRFINISVKSELHKERNQKLIQYQAESCSAMVSTPQPSEKRTKNKVYTKNQGS